MPAFLPKQGFTCLLSLSAPPHAACMRAAAAGASSLPPAPYLSVGRGVVLLEPGEGAPSQVGTVPPRHAGRDQVAHNHDRDRRHQEAAPRQLLAPAGGAGGRASTRSLLGGRGWDNMMNELQEPGRVLEAAARVKFWGRGVYLLDCRAEDPPFVAAPPPRPKFQPSAHRVDISIANSTAPTGALNAVVTPHAAPHATRSRMSLLYV
jgi:hypothetical protein